MPIDWIDMKAVEEFASGDSSMYLEALAVVQQVAQMVLFKKFPGCRTSDEDDMLSVAEINTMEKLQQPFVDFVNFSSFNFVFYKCRNAMTNYYRKIPKEEIREGDMTSRSTVGVPCRWEQGDPYEQYNRSAYLFNAPKYPTAHQPEDYLTEVTFQEEYDRLEFRMKIFGLKVKDFTEAVFQGYNVREDRSHTKDTLMVASLRTLFPQEVVTT